MSEKIDWQLEISTTLQIKKAIREIDGGKLFNFCPPNPGASWKNIRKAEECLRIRFPSDMREFYKTADGWAGFGVGNSDLFCVSDYAGSPRFRSAMEETLWLHEEGAITSSEDSLMIPICRSEETSDIFVMTVSVQGNLSTISWIAGEEVDRFGNFLEFFRAMQSYDERHLMILNH